MTFSPEGIRELEDARLVVRGKHDDLILQYINRTYKSARAREHATQGFARRLKILARCIDNVFEIIPPTRTKKLIRDERSDAEINLQAFVFNMFGAVDNLAWIWVSERGLTEADGSAIRKSSVGLRKHHKLVRRSFSSACREYLKTRDDWFEYAESYRHALAHRIPLYIPPYIVTPDRQAMYDELENRKLQAMSQHDYGTHDRLEAEQGALGVFRPLMTHSFEEGSTPVVFHPQMLADFNTIEEIAQKMLSELDAVSSP